MSTAGKVLLITGGTRGLGLALARHMARVGWSLALVDLSERACSVYGEATSVDDVLAELRSHGIEARFYTADLTGEPATAQVVAAVQADFGGIDALATMAGGDIHGHDDAAAGGKAPDNTAFASWENFESIFQRNFLTMAHTCRAVAPLMAEREAGSIVTMASVSAGFGVSRETAYATAKAAVVHFTRSLATELRPVGINVNCLAPGATNTGRFRATLADRTPADLERLKGRGRLERLAEPEDVCRVIEFFVSPAAGFISGQVLRVDGGQFTTPI